jgi:uncharacterized membrane protein (DUF2068 family)
MVNNTLVPRQRPVGVTVIAVLEAIAAVLEILGGIFLLSTSTTLGVIAIVVGVIYLVLAWGLWTLKPWAFWITAVLNALAVVSGIYMLIQGNYASIVETIVALAVLVYLFADHNVRAAFRT